MNTIRRFRNAAYLLLMVLASATFTSCDEDKMEAMTLHGDWYGDFGMNYEYEEPIYDRYGHIVGKEVRRFDSYDTKIHFHQRGFSNHGTGTQIDYYEHGPYEYMYYDFDWRIENGVIKLRYRWANEWDTDIINYSLTNTRFAGTFDFSRVHFSLLSLDNYDWDIRNPYYQEYGYGCDIYSGYGGYYPYHYYAPAARGTENKVTTEKSDSAYIPSMQEIRIGNRYAKK